MCVRISGIARLSFSFVQARSSNVWTMITSDSGFWIDFRQNKNCRGSSLFSLRFQFRDFISVTRVHELAADRAKVQTKDVGDPSIDARLRERIGVH